MSQQIEGSYSSPNVYRAQSQEVLKPRPSLLIGLIGLIGISPCPPHRWQPWASWRPSFLLQTPAGARAGLGAARSMQAVACERNVPGSSSTTSSWTRPPSPANGCVHGETSTARTTTPSSVVVRGAEVELTLSTAASHGRHGHV